MSGEYLKELEEFIAKWKNAKIAGDDRLKMVAATRNLLFLGMRSLNYWNTWVTNPNWMNKFSEVEMKDMLGDLKDGVLQLLVADAKWTRRGGEKRKKRENDKNSEPPKRMFV